MIDKSIVIIYHKGPVLLMSGCEASDLHLAAELALLMSIYIVLLQPESSEVGVSSRSLRDICVSTRE